MIKSLGRINELAKKQRWDKNKRDDRDTRNIQC